VPRLGEYLALSAVVLWAALWGVASYFNWHRLLQPLAFIAFTIPLAAGYVAARILPGRTDSRRSSAFFIAPVSVFLALLAYVCCAFAVGRLAMLIPDFYKLGRTLIDHTLSSVALWAVVTAVCLVTALAIRRYVASTSFSGMLSRATVGIVMAGVFILGLALLSPYAKLRA
jgi:hypothetical protein